MTLISVVIPVYNGEKTIEILFNEIIKTFSLIEDYSVEVIFVHDCGIDNSWKIIKQITNSNKGIVKGIKLSRNFGQHNALICGFSKATGNFIVTIDEDLQQSPADIIKLIEKQKENDYDVVYGKFMNQQHSYFRNLTSKLLKLLLVIGIPELHPDYSALRLIKSNIASELPRMQNSYCFLDGYLTWITTHVASVPVSHKFRKIGKSSYNLKRLIEHSINIFITFSNLPIRILSYSSLLIFVITICYSSIIAFQYFIGQITVPGYASLIIILGLGLGFILMGLGIVGEYIYRINLKTTKRPNYIINEIKYFDS